MFFFSFRQLQSLFTDPAMVTTVVGLGPGFLLVTFAHPRSVALSAANEGTFNGFLPFLLLYFLSSLNFLDLNASGL